MASVRGRGGDGSSPVAFADQQDLGTSRPRPCRVRLGDLNSYHRPTSRLTIATTHHATRNTHQSCFPKGL